MDETLGARLQHQPVPLKFGTSGRRGQVIHLSQLEIYINVRAELRYLQSLPVTAGGIRPGDEFFYAYDLRPSSTRFVAEQGGKGEIAQAVARAIQDAGMKPVNLGQLPTPALTYYALQRRCGSIMITGSHIPFDRNGYKTNSAHGELRKTDENPIGERAEQVRAEILGQAFDESLFDGQGMLKTGATPLAAPRNDAVEFYFKRYTDYFAGLSLRGLRLLVYQHSAVGRDLLPQLLRRLGAEVIEAGRSETFVPIDTENLERDQLERIQSLANEAWRAHGRLDAVVSTDGDSDRPLILGVEEDSSARGCRVEFYNGDLVGMRVAMFLQPDAVVVPISCNDAVDRSSLQAILEPKTKIGSPFVLAGMDKAKAKGRTAVCGWEANGGFLTGSDFRRGEKVLAALPTRDAILPILSVLFTVQVERKPLPALFGALPKRFGRAGLIREFPRATGQRIVRGLAPTDPLVQEVAFSDDSTVLLDENGKTIAGEVQTINQSRARLEQLFAVVGVGRMQRLNFVDGVRMYFSKGEVAHLRPSGNADEMRIYAVANTVSRSDEIVQAGIRESDGILRQLEKLFG